MAYRIPTNTLADLRRYVENHEPQGGFLTAVLANDLYVACRKADQYNRACLADIAAYVDNELPIPCRGSYEAVREWTSIRVAT